MDERDNRRRALDSQNPTALIGVDGQARIASLPDDRIIFTSPALRVNAVAHDQAVEPILTGPAAFFTLDPEHRDLPTRSRNVIAPSWGITTTPQLATRAPSALLPLRCR